MMAVAVTTAKAAATTFTEAGRIQENKNNISLLNKKQKGTETKWAMEWIIWKSNSNDKWVSYLVSQSVSQFLVLLCPKTFLCCFFIFPLSKSPTFSSFLLCYHCHLQHCFHHLLVFLLDHLCRITGCHLLWFLLSAEISAKISPITVF